MAEGRITEADADRLRHWVADGYLILERGVLPDDCDRLRADLEAAFRDGDERLLMHSPQNEDYRPLSAGTDTERVRVVDVYAFYQSARVALFSEPIDPLPTDRIRRRPASVPEPYV